MNTDPQSAPAHATSPLEQLEDKVREHPVSTLLLVAGLGVAAAFAIRALAPQPPQNRALRLLEEIQDRLSDLAEEGSVAINKGVESLGDLHLDRKLSDCSRSFWNLFR